MSRKETSNTWSDGLVMDLNPMNTPNTVLTDNLNGTLITYNGNEHLLQNDQGNFKLKHCKLSPNFVPVGLKEYADILYIVSYNPITEETEIGSYPSPKVVFEQTNGNGVYDEAFAIDNCLANSAVNELIYTNVDPYNYNYVFAGDTSKLNPGDQFQLTRTIYNSSPIPLYEGITYSIIDSDKKLHDISDIIEDYLDNKSEASNVLWDVPGWLCVSSKIADFDSFGMTITNFSCENNEIVIGYRFQLNIDDPILISKFKKEPFDVNITGFYLDLIDLELKERISDTEETIKRLSYDSSADEKIEWIIKDWYDGNIIIQASVEHHFTLSEDSTDRTVNIECTPILKDPFGGRNYSIRYDHLKETINADFNNFVTVGNDKLQFGTETYQFMTDTSTLVNFNVVLETSDNNDVPVMTDIKLYAKAFTLDGNAVNDGFKELTSHEDLIIDSEGDNPSENTCYVDALGLEKEYIYKVIFVLDTTEPEESSNTLNKTKENLKLKYFEKVLITSKIFSTYANTYNNFEEIPMNTWVTDYINTYFKGGKLSVANVTSTKRNSPVTTWNKDETYWSQKGFITTNNKNSEEVTIAQEYDVNFTFTDTQNEKLKEHRIGMWKYLIKDPKYYLSGLKNSEGISYEDDVEVIPSSITSDYYGGVIGEWDVDTANIYKNTISYNNFVSGTQTIDFSEPSQFDNFALDYSYRDLKIYKLKLNPVYYDSDEWKCTIYTVAGTKAGSFEIPVEYNYDVAGHDRYSDVLNKINIGHSDFDVVLFEVIASVAEDKKGHDYTRFGYGVKTTAADGRIIYDLCDQFWTHGDHKRGEQSTVKHLLYFRGIDIPVFYDSGHDSYTQMQSIFEGCKIISGTNPNTYYAFVPSKGSLLEDKKLGCSLISVLSSEDKWKINGVELFVKSDKALLNWDGNLEELKINTTVEYNEDSFSFDQNSSDIDSKITEVDSKIKDSYEDFNKYNEESGFLGLKGGSSSSVSIIKQNVKVNNYLYWNDTSKNYLIIGSSDSSKQYNINLGYYIS